MFYSYLLVFCLACSFCLAQDNLYYAEGQQQQYNAPQPQHIIQEVIHYHTSPPDGFNRRSFDGNQQYSSQVFTLPDGSIKVVPVPQGF